MSRTTKLGLVLLLGCLTAAARAEELQWRPTGSAGGSGGGVHLGAPVPLGQVSSLTTATGDGVAPRAEALPFRPAGWIVRGQAPGVPPVPPPPLPGTKPLGEEAYNCAIPGTPAPAAGQGGFFGDFMKCVANPTGGRKCLESDHCFDMFISPVTNPNEFEDPRALTEFRPVFSFQQAKVSNPVFHGGDIENLNFQTRVALTDWFSITIHELGWTWIEAHHPTPDIHTHSGFSEVQIGPKFTFLRNTTAGPIFGPSVAAAGLVFELPVGGHDVVQDTGWLSLRPYVSYAQEFLGQFHFMGTAGYDFGVDNDRSDHLFLSAHFDYDVARLHTIYPFIEMNYFLYTSNGHARALNFEGANLINFGSTHVSGQSELDLALGARYKFSEHFQVGGAVEFGVVGSRDLLSYGLVLDMIFRY